MSVGLLPVSERITVELERRLKALIHNRDYNTRVHEVVRPKRLETVSPRDGQIVLEVASHSRVPELDCPGNPPAKAWRITFAINVWQQSDEQSCTAIDTFMAIASADVVKAVGVTGVDWVYFGELAIDSEWESTEYSKSADGGMDAVNVPLSVTYRVTEGNPYEVRN